MQHASFALGNKKGPAKGAFHIAFWISTYLKIQSQIERNMTQTLFAIGA